jgi:DNA-binding NarL/FixJ family response regulator
MTDIGGRHAGDEVFNEPLVDRVKNISEARDRSSSFAVIDRRTLERECFVRVIEAAHSAITITAHGSISEWKAHGSSRPLCAILLNVGGRRASEAAVGEEIQSLVETAEGIPVIVLAESEEIAEMIAAVDNGARGYIPASVGADVVIDAARLTSAGGVFLPASSVLGLREAILNKVESKTEIESYFTSRQAAVADALRRGKANKTIAYELNMCESTVKVHIRTIMKKLHATNRTQAAFKLNTIFPSDSPD